MIKFMFKFILIVTLLAGWVLAAASVHVVRKPGPIPKLGMIQIIPKDSLSFKETWLDTTHWTRAELDRHEILVKRLKNDKEEWISDLAKRIEKQVLSVEK
jgi:hypothetical protein